MTTVPSPIILTLGEMTPQIDPEAWIAPNSVVIGNVSIGKESSIWFNVTIRGDIEFIRIGERVNIQDNVVLHVDDDFPLIVGNNVTVGHSALLHGCTIEDNVLIGMGAVVLNGAIIRKGAQIGAGAVIPPGMEVPENMMALGVPAKVKRELLPQEHERKVYGVNHYVNNAKRFKTSLRGI